MRLRRAAAVGGTVALASAALLAAVVAAPPAGAAPAADRSVGRDTPAVVRRAVVDPAAVPPTFAYFYIWFDPTSWSRAKKDYPLLGRYSSDDAQVMRTQVRWAKEAGIQGFIVGWKDTPTLDRRLEQLTQIAEQEDFDLILIYQALDFQRDPLPADRVAADLDTFAARWAGRQPFRAFGKPIVIWSGTWKYAPEDVARVTGPRRPGLTILASEKNADDYERIAGSVDGNAYYWSSVNPDTYPQYVEKLTAMGRAVHQNGGLWIAPAAPGFDARDVGGSGVVPRDGGKTFQREIDTALASNPDILGIISWNEFSENTFIEPSTGYSDTYLQLVKDRLGPGSAAPDDFLKAAPTTTTSPADGIPDPDSSSSGIKGPRTGLLVIGAFVIGGCALPVVASRRRRRRDASRGPGARGDDPERGDGPAVGSTAGGPGGPGGGRRRGPTSPA